MIDVASHKSDKNRAVERFFAAGIQSHIFLNVYLQYNNKFLCICMHIDILIFIYIFILLLL
jgi:hypothetical protein